MVQLDHTVKKTSSYRAALLLLLAPIHVTVAAPNTADNQREAILQQWRAMFGAVAFESSAVFENMILIHPKPTNTFLPFRDQVLSSNIVRHRNYWLRQVFKGELYIALTNTPPTGFYLNQGRSEPSLLRVEVALPGQNVTLQESYNAFLLRVTPPGFQIAPEVRNDVIGTVLLNWVNLKKRTLPDPAAASTPEIEIAGRYFQSDRPNDAYGDLPTSAVKFDEPFRTVDDLVQAFDLPGRLTIGDVFTNRSRGSQRPSSFWQENIVGFVANHGVYLLIRKEDGKTMFGDVHYDFNWLNKGLFSADGRILVDPPQNRHINESPDLDGGRLK